MKTVLAVIGVMHFAVAALIAAGVADLTQTTQVVLLASFGVYLLAEATEYR